MYFTGVTINRDSNCIELDFTSLDETLAKTIYLATPTIYKPIVYLTGLWMKHNTNERYDVDFTYGDSYEEVYKKVHQLNHKCNLKSKG